MGLSNFLSTLALVSLTFSFDLVAARPFGHKHDQHMTLTKTVRSTYTTTLNDATAEGAHSTFYTTLYTTIHHGGAGASSVISSESETPEVATQTPSGSRATSATSPSATEGSSSNGLYPPQTYTLVKEFCNGGTAFFDEFNFYTGSDPTNGFVDYVDRTTAQNNHLIGVSNNTVYLAPDSVNVASGGRQSVRLESIDTFNEVLVIADFEHLPNAVCGSWPAFWTSNLNNWPTGGEIDIIEGVNLNTANHVALHTTSGLVVQGEFQTGSFDTTNCDVNAAGQPSNAGCGGYASQTNSYSDVFNAAGGGVYAMDWRAEGIRVWHWTRGNIPSDILAGAPTTADWGEPDFDFYPTTSGSIAPHFNDHQIIFDMTFCGDWAGSVYSTSGCPSTCTDFVANNPTAFTDHYFGINSLAVYQAS